MRTVFTLLAACAVLATPHVVRAQVIPGSGMGPSARDAREAYYAQVRSELQAARQSWAQLWENRNGPGLEALFDPQAVSLVGGVGAGEARGPEDIVRQMLGHAVAGGYTSLTTADFTTTGDLAVESGYVLAQPPRTGAVHGTLTGTYVLVYLRDFHNHWHIREQVLFFKE